MGMCAAGMYDCNSWNGVSEQQMVDCCSYNSNLNPYDNHGCSGGFQSNAMRCIIQNGGVDSWDNYAYTSGNNGREHTCAYNPRNSSAPSVAAVNSVEPTTRTCLSI